MNRTLHRFGTAACLLGIAVGVFGVAQSEPTAAEPFAPLTLDLSDIGPSHVKFLPDPPEGQVTVQFLARAINARIPGEFRFYLAAPEVRRLWTTLSLPQGAAVPKGALLENGIAFVEPGKFYSLEVVYENPTDREIRFLVVAPEVDPQAALPFARARCWCASIPFSAPPGGAFLRTIQVGVALNTPPGAKVIVLEEIRRVLEAQAGGRPPCLHVRRLLQEKVAEVARRIAELEALRRALEARLRWAEAHPDPACDGEGRCVYLTPPGEDISPG